MGGSARLPKLFVVELQVGEKISTSEGRTRQQAKHEAALAALEYYEKHPAPEKLPRPAVQLPQSMLSGNSKDQENQPKKSEVSLVYELALKRNLHVHFEKDLVCFFSIFQKKNFFGIFSEFFFLIIL